MKNKMKGKLEIICGSMFSGKTEELIRRLRRAQLAQIKTQVFKHSLDNRVAIEKLYAHSGSALSAIAVDTVAAFKSLLLDDTQIIGIDEVQFFSTEIIEEIYCLVDARKHVIVAGLDLDFRGLPFNCMPPLMALADEVTKLKAVCLECGDDAHFSQRLVNGKPAKLNDPVVLIGSQEFYQARCRACYQIDQRPKEFIKYPEKPSNFKAGI